MMGELFIGRYVSYCEGLDKRKCTGRIAGLVVIKDEPRFVIIKPDGKFDTKLIHMVTLAED